MFCATFADPSYTVVSCDTVGSMIVLSSDELIQMSPFYLDIGSAVEIAGAILMLMAVAWLLRQGIKSLEES